MSTLTQKMSRRALKMGVPLSVQLDIACRCNECCVRCYLDHDGPGEMTTAKIHGLLDQLADGGVSASSPLAAAKS